MKCHFRRCSDPLQRRFGTPPFMLRVLEHAKPVSVMSTFHMREQPHTRAD